MVADRAAEHPVPVAPARLADLIANLIDNLIDNLHERVIAGSLVDSLAPSRHGRLRVAVDGSPAAHPGRLADSLVDPLRALGRPAARVSGGDFLRPASVRLENGRTDPDSYRSGWLDAGALQREVLAPFAAGGRAGGRFLPTRWDDQRDRATRATPVEAPAGTVLLVDGTFLLDRNLDFDLTVHLSLSVGTLGRRLPEALRWTLPAYAGYDGSERADVVVRLDDVAHPAVLVRRRS